MTTSAERSRAGLTTFLVLTFGLSAIFYALIIAAGSLGAHGGLYVFALMWSPGVSALITRLVFQHNVRGEGWRWGGRWMALAYVLPLGYATVAYGLVWLTRLGGVDLSRFKYSVLTFLVVGSLQSLLSATGEELGWRGFLVPALAQRFSFTRVAILSGAIWAAWHVPLIIFADYNGGTPAWYSVLCFAVMVVALGFPFAWLRLRSGSVWHRRRSCTRRTISSFRPSSIGSRSTRARHGGSPASSARPWRSPSWLRRGSSGGRAMPSRPR